MLLADPRPLRDVGLTQPLVLSHGTEGGGGALEIHGRQSVPDP